MKKLVALFCAAGILCLTSCVYRPAFEQGNILTPAKVQSITPGMTSAQVTAKLGSPVLENMYSDNRMTYVYTSSPSHSKIVVKKVMIEFKNDHVVNIRTAL